MPLLIDDKMAAEAPDRNDAIRAIESALKQQTTLHYNFSACVPFAAAGYPAYRYAKKNGRGRALPLEWLQQDRRTRWSAPRRTSPWEI